VSIASAFEILRRCARNLVVNPRTSLNRLAGSTELQRANELVVRWPLAPAIKGASPHAKTGNSIREYFDAIQDGPGVWKWLHYFDIYQQHLEKFVDTDAVLAEVGVYSGGSIGMWKNFLGDRCRIIGIDIQEECRVYENTHTTIRIGDQGDPEFWASFRDEFPRIDILIDDGGHRPEQQMATIESMLPHLSAGGIYICEDIHRTGNRFSSFVSALSDHLNAFSPNALNDGLSSTTSPFQAAIHSLHVYPYAVVIEKRVLPIESFSAPKRGSQWQPFLS
jgi:hypothetical protein